MRVLILTPASFPSISGNAVTVERWRRSLTNRGIEVSVLAIQGMSPAALVRHVEHFGPNLIHAHHAFKAGAILLDPVVALACAAIPVVVSPGGTDIHSDLEVQERKDIVIRVFDRACAAIVQSEEIAECLRQRALVPNHKIIRVPKAICWMSNELYDLRRLIKCNRDHVLFFLPAGIRPVKGNLECLLAMEKVYEIRPNARFVASGPAVDVAYSARFEREIARLSSFAHWIDAIPPGAMKSAYEASDVVVNSSFSEGLANSLLEGIASGRAILASDIPGNRWAVIGENGDASAGLLYNAHDPEDFVRNAVQLMDDGDQRRAFGRAIESRKSKWPSPEEEARGLITAYEKAQTLR